MTLYKVLGTDGQSIHGGSGSWFLPKGSRPGKWMPVVENVNCCERGYHLVELHALAEWLAADCTIWRAEGRGATHTDGTGKTAFAQARLVKRLHLSDTDLRLFAADCAEHVLHIFEAACRNDDRPRNAIEAARAYARGDIDVGDLAAAWVAARAAAWAATSARAAAQAAQAARAAAWAATSARAAAQAAWAAAWAATSAAAWAAERKWQGERLATHLREDA